MRIIGLAVAASIALNAWVLWTLREGAHSNPEPSYEAAPAQGSSASSGSHPDRDVAPASLEAIASLREEIAALNTRLSGFETSLAALEKASSAQAAGNVSQQALSSRIERLKTGHSPRAAATSEDWFWSSQGENRSEAVIPDGESYTVQSLVCRSDWCRAEIQLDESTLDAPEAELELQLSLSEAMGRDIEMSFGDRSGSNQVVFIRAD